MRAEVCMMINATGSFLLIAQHSTIPRSTPPVATSAGGAIIHCFLLLCFYNLTTITEWVVRLPSKTCVQTTRQPSSYILFT